MPVSLKTAAYAAIVLVGTVLFSIGKPTESNSNGQGPVTPATAATPTSSVASGNGVTLKSVSVDLPNSDRSFPGGAAAEVVADNCTACHSPGMVLYQPALTSAQWQAEVNHMIKDFKAPIAESDVPAIVAYLVSTKGAK